MICMKRAQPSTFSQSDADSAFSLYTLLDASGIVVLEPGNFPSTHGHGVKSPRTWRQCSRFAGVMSLQEENSSMKRYVTCILRSSGGWLLPFVS